MTWSATFRVEDVSYPPVEVRAVAEGDAITSNTEGKITRMELRASIEGDETSLKAGDTFYASGHFTA